MFQPSRANAAIKAVTSSTKFAKFAATTGQAMSKLKMATKAKYTKALDAVKGIFGKKIPKARKATLQEKELIEKLKSKYKKMLKGQILLHLKAK